MEFKHSIVLILLFFLVSLKISAEVLFEVNFSNAHGNVEAWLNEHGWKIKGSIGDMNTRFENGSLILEPTDDDSVLISRELNRSEFLNNVKEIKIIWGVSQYPKGADWSGPREKKRNTREPIAVIISFGEEKIDSGGRFFPPNAPYFIGLFLGEKEKPGIAYYGNFYQKGGRYFCESCTGTSGQFTTVVDINERFRSIFGKHEPPISAISIEVDVEDTQKVNGVYSKAYIKSIILSR